MSLNLGTILQTSAGDRPGKVAIRLGPREVRYAELDRAASPRASTRAGSGRAKPWRS